MTLALIKISTNTKNRRANLPSCVNSISVSWHKDLNATVLDEGVYYIQDSIGVRSDTVFYGQYLTDTSGQINFYRTSGTFSYTDPSDGSSVTGVSIPGDGLYTIPEDGICDIITSDGSEYPICERAGTVLHDVANEVHISVLNPVWGETLYGSDYLNQNGYKNETQSDAEGYDWTTSVNGSSVALNDNTLIPLKEGSSNTDARGLSYIVIGGGRVRYDLINYEQLEFQSGDTPVGNQVPDGDETITL